MKMRLPGGQKSCKYVFVAQKIRFTFKNAFYTRADALGHRKECFKGGGVLNSIFSKGSLPQKIYYTIGVVLLCVGN